jgi:hypothetical protein
LAGERLNLILQGRDCFVISFFAKIIYWIRLG